MKQLAVLLLFLVGCADAMLDMFLSVMTRLLFVLLVISGVAVLLFSSDATRVKLAIRLFAIAAICLALEVPRFIRARKLRYVRR